MIIEHSRMVKQNQDLPAPSAWVARFAPLIVPDGAVLDLAAGGGRHTRLLRNLGHPVLAVDRDLSGLTSCAANDPGLELLVADLEDGTCWPLGTRVFAGVVVTNYLYRPILNAIVASLGDRGALIYETFAIGNEAFGRPHNPDFLLRPGELLELAGRHDLQVIAYENGIEDANGAPRVVQRICAVRDQGSRRLGSPPPGS
jgi:SAM-dependent methyltransferase